MVDETPTDGASEQRRQVENEAVLKRALNKVSGRGDEFGAKLSQSLDVVRRALDEFGGETGNGLAISFNGGKDACVVLYLLLFVLAERGELWRLYSSTKGRKVRQPRMAAVLSHRLAPLAGRPLQIQPSGLSSAHGGSRHGPLTKTCQLAASGKRQRMVYRHVSFTPMSRWRRYRKMQDKGEFAYARKKRGGEGGGCRCR